MLTGKRVRLRPFRDEELSLIEGWVENREEAIGAYQPYLLGQGAMIRKALQGNPDPSRDGGLLAIEIDGGQVIGFVRYSMLPLVRDSVEFYDIGYAITDPSLRQRGYASEACSLLVEYLFRAYPIERIGALVTPENEPSMRLLARLGFRHEGTLRRVLFFDGCWHDLAIFGLLREEWTAPISD